MKNKKYPPVIIFGDSITSFSIIRGLKNIGIEIFIVSDHGKGNAIYSKYVKDTLVISTENSRYVEKVIDWIKKKTTIKPVLMIAGNDKALKILSKNYSILTNYTIPTFPRWKIVKQAYIKNNTYKIARKIKIPVIESISIKNLFQLKNYLKKKNIIKFPVFLKCNDSSKFSNIYRTKGIVCNSKKEIIKMYHKYNGFFGDLILQEFIPGDIDNIYAVLIVLNKKSELISITANEKIRASVLYGSTTLSSSIWDKRLIDQAIKIAKFVGYIGFVNVQFKYDPRDKKFKILEINGRFTVSTFLSQSCGFNLPKIVYEEFTNKKQKVLKVVKKNYKNNILLWFPFSDLRLLFQKKFYKNLTKYLLAIKKNNYTIAPYSLDDPMPFLINIKKKLKRRLIKFIGLR